MQHLQTVQPQTEMNSKGLQLLVFVLFIIGCDQNNSTLKRDDNQEKVLFSRLERSYEMEDYQRCREQAQEFVKEYPGNSFGWSLLAGSTMSFRTDSLDSLACMYADQAIAIDSRNYVALVNRAILMDRKGEYSEASKLYERVRAIMPEYPQLYSNYAGNRLRVKDYQRAVEYGEIALSLSDNMSDKSVLCLSYHFTGDTVRRDSLVNVLIFHEYPQIEGLMQIFNNR